MTRKQRRLTLIGSALAVLAVAAGLILYNLTKTITFFKTPTELAEEGFKPGMRLRIGGLVKEGTLQRGPNQTVHFEVTDTNRSVPVTYQGLLPDLFREGQGVVADGALQPSGEFKADSVLAKHDEKYMPKEVADALKQQGMWQHTGDKAKESAPNAAPAAAKPGA